MLFDITSNFGIIPLSVGTGSLIGIFYAVLSVAQLILVIVGNRYPKKILLAYLVEIGALVAIALNIESFLKIGSNNPLLSTSISFVSLLLVGSVFIYFWSRNQIPISSIFSDIFEVFWIPNLLFFAGLILFFQGWRLDPLLQIQAILIAVVMMYLFFRLGWRSQR